MHHEWCNFLDKSSSVVLVETKLCKKPDLKGSSVSSVGSIVIRKERRRWPPLAVDEVDNTSSCEEFYSEVIFLSPSTSSTSCQSDSQKNKNLLPKGCTTVDNKKLDEHKNFEKK